MDNGKLVDVISAHLPLKSVEKQEILEIDSVPRRIEKILEVIHRETELAELEKDINARTKKRMGKTQRNYFLSEKVKVIQNEIGQNEDGVDEIGELEQSLEKKKLPKIAREKATKELKKLRNMPPMSAETTVVRNYVDCILGLPWSKKTKAKIDIIKAENILDEDHFGLEKPVDIKALNARPFCQHAAGGGQNLHQAPGIRPGSSFFLKGGFLSNESEDQCWVDFHFGGLL